MNTDNRCLPDTTDRPVSVENSRVDILAMDWVGKEWLDDELAKINLKAIRTHILWRLKATTHSRFNCQYGICGNWSAQAQVGKQLIFIPAILVSTGVVAVHAQVVA